MMWWHTVVLCSQGRHAKSDQY